ncbi:MAG TPA: hypothetical protein VL326_15990 [Kofleriaceae bacterium]|nr:hypothetical protein [Kofleriaceae bacterium]
MRTSLLVALLGVAACSASAPAQRPVKAPQPAVAQTAPSADACPLHLDGASLEIKEVEQGVALEFTTYEDVSELRRRVRILGDIQHAEGKRFLEDVEGGARIVFPAEYHDQVVAIGDVMNKGACLTKLPTKPDEQIVVAR